MVDIVDYVFFATVLSGFLNVILSKKLDLLPLLLLSLTIIILAAVIEVLKLMNLPLGWVGAVYLLLSMFASLILLAGQVFMLFYRLAKPSEKR